MSKRKYPEVKGWWVYSIKIPSVNKYYIGISKRQCCERWNKSRYKDMALNQYLDEWDSMIKTVLIDGLSKEEALIYEDALIQELNNLCINERRSGLITKDINTYQRELYQNNSEYRERQKKRSKQYRENNKEKVLEQKKQYYEDNKEQIKEYQKQRYKEYYQNNKEKKKQYQLENKERIREYQRQYYKRKKLEKQQHTVVD